MNCSEQITRTFIRMSKYTNNGKTKLTHVFKYERDNIKCSSRDIERIKKLGIPPNWKNVVISNSELSHLQATGFDDKNRIQYIYHPMWVFFTSSEKYSRMGKFSKKYNLLESRIKTDLRDNKIIAIMFRILQKTFIRVGNDCYAKDNGTYGLTSLEKRHITLSQSTKNINLSFIGKKSVEQSTNFKDPCCFNYIKSILNGLKPKDRIFNISPLTMNNYLQSIMGCDFTCKDFRTYGSNILFLKILCKFDPPKSQKEIKQNLISTYDQVANKLGHTRAISKKSYVMSIIPEQYTINPNQFSNKNPNILFKMMCF